MNDTLVTIIAIFLAAVLMFIFPLVTMSDRTDDVAKVSVQTATTNLVDKIRTTGVLYASDYDSFIQELTATGYNYDVEMQVKTQDSNLGKKVTQSMSTFIGETVGHSNYTSQMEQELDSEGKYVFKEGDMVSVKVKNSSTTLSQQLSGQGSEDTYVISAEHSGIVTTNGN